MFYSICKQINAYYEYAPKRHTQLKDRSRVGQSRNYPRKTLIITLSLPSYFRSAPESLYFRNTYLSNGESLPTLPDTPQDTLNPEPEKSAKTAYILSADTPKKTRRTRASPNSEKVRKLGMSLEN